MLDTIFTLPFAAGLLAVIFGLSGLVRGRQMRYGDRLDLVTDWDGNPVPNREAFAKPFGRVYLGCGTTMLLMPMLLVLGMNVLIWIGINVVIIWIWFYLIDSVVIRAQKTNMPFLP